MEPFPTKPFAAALRAAPQGDRFAIDPKYFFRPEVPLPGLMVGLFGTRAWMARRAGQTTSAAKAAAARANGAKGGRPRKSADR